MKKAILLTTILTGIFIFSFLYLEKNEPENPSPIMSISKTDKFAVNQESQAPTIATNKKDETIKNSNNSDTFTSAKIPDDKSSLSEENNEPIGQGITQDSLYQTFISEDIQIKLANANVNFINSICRESECDLIFVSNTPFHGDTKLQNNTILELGSLLDELSLFENELILKQNPSIAEEIILTVKKN